MPDTQDVDSLFPPPKAGDPQDVDSLFPQSVEAERHATNYGERSGSTVQDLIFGDATRNPVARVLDAFGEGYKEGWGSGTPGLSDQSVKALRDHGIFNDYQKGQNSIVKAGNEVLMRPAATALEAVWRAGAGAFRGSQAAIAQVGEETGHPLLGREIAALPEAFPFGTAHVIGEAPSLLETARSMRIIGKGEAGWKGTTPAEQPAAPVPEKIEPSQEVPTGTSEQVPLTSAAATAPPPAPVPNVHQVARQSNPDLFAKYDPLTEQQTQLRMFIDEGIDSTAARTKLAQVDKDLADLSPQVAQAYRDAADKTNAITIPPTGQFNSMAEMLAKQGDNSLEAQRAFIANDVSRQLVAAGRPADEAQASGAVAAAQYMTRAARFNGALGTGKELYEREGAEIRGPGGTKAPTGTPPVAPAPAGIDATHDVVSGANSSKGGNTVYIDKRIPQYSPTLKDSAGNPVDLWNLLQLHERVEADEMAKGVPYDQAHIAATGAERELAHRTGIDFDAYTKEIDGYLSKIENEKAENPPAEPLHVNSEAAIEHHKSTNKKPRRYIGGTPSVAEWQKSGMIENAEAYKAAAKARRDKYGSGGGKVYRSALARDREQGITSGQVKAEQSRFDEGLTVANIGADDIPSEVRSMAIEAMVDRGMEPLDALDYAEAKFEHEAGLHESENARLAAEGIINTEEGHGDLLGEVPFDTGEHAAGAGEAGQGAGAQDHAATGEPAREAGEALEYFQNRKSPRNLIAEREAEGQLQLPGADRITQAEQVQRRANEPLKLSVEQKPMNVGLFSDEAKQKELFQMRAPRAHGKDYYQIKAFHGSPYDFDKFDLSKIGTGEGAQAYGHGLYFAENPSVAQTYAQQLAQKARTQPIPADIRSALKSVGDLGFDRPGQALNVFRDILAGKDSRQNWDLDRPEDAAAVKTLFDYAAQPRAQEHRYQVSINADPEHFLDWDKPLSEQSPQVQQAAQSIQHPVTQAWQTNGAWDHALGKNLYDVLGGGRTNAAVASGKTASAADQLRQAGIPGIKYLDQGSRGSGNGTRNYVLFDDSLIKITHKDGVPVSGAERDAVVKELYQRQQDARDLAQGPQGRVRITPDRKPIITLAKTADASTFIHESGHVYLEELMRDAEHPQAPGLLRADAETVKQWLGVDSAKNIKTSHHEKFARGFEQYLREGVAPSASLARVFAQFRNWLLNIYQTIRGLGAPITDDIRGVFDRMLAEKPERTVIAPELAKPPTLADIHEADAALAEPHQAEPTADRIVAEAERYRANLPGDVTDEHARSATETGTRPAEPRPLPGAVGASEPVIPGDQGGAPTGAELSGGNEPVPEGTGTRSEQKPVGPNDPLPRSEGHFIDKAGNIRLDNLGTPEDVNAVIRQAAQENNDFLPQRRNVVSDQQVLDLADALGMTPEQLNTRRLGQAFNAEQVMAARKLLIQSANTVRDAATKAAAGTDADVLAYAIAADRHRMIQGQVAGITAEAGRALRAFRSLAGADEARAVGNTIQDITGRTLFQLRDQARKIANLDTAEKVSKFVRDSERKGLFDWMQSLFVNALISGPFTHATYTAAGQLYGLFRAVGVGGASAFSGAVRSAIGFGETERAEFGEIPHQLYGMFRGTRNGVKAAWASLKSNQVVLPPEVQRQMDLGVTGQTIATHAVIPNPSVGGITIPIGTALESPGRVVAALHSFNWTTFYSQSISAQAFRQAMKEGAAGDRFAQRAALLTESPTDEMVMEASKDANAGALMQRPDYDSAMGAVSRLTNIGVRVPDIPLPGGRSFPMGTLRPLKYIDPFVQIAGNIMRVGLVRDTPLAAFSQAVRDDLSMKNGGAAFDRAAGRMLAGTSFMLAAGGLASEGILNWSGPSDPKESREWQRVYGLPHGLRIGNMSYDVLRLGPMGMQMSIAADVWHLSERMGQEDASKVSVDLVHAFAQNIVDESFMRGPAEIMQAIDDYDRYGASWIRNFAASFVPFSVGLGQMAHMVDPYSRIARTTMDAIKAKIPFVSETLVPRRDIWGEPIPSRGWLGTYRQSIANDPVDQALYALHVYPALPERRIRGVQLTDQQYDDYTRIAGRDAHMRVNAMVTMPGFAVMPTGPKIELINKAISGSRDRARNLVMMKYPDIIQQAIAAKQAKVNPTLH